MVQSDQQIYCLSGCWKKGGPANIKAEVREQMEKGNWKYEGKPHSLTKTMIFKIVFKIAKKLKSL